MESFTHLANTTWGPVNYRCNVAQLSAIFEAV